MNESSKLTRFEQELISSLMAEDNYDHIMEPSLSLRSWEKERLEQPPVCDKCGAVLDTEYLAFRRTTDPKTWIRLCRNRVGCRNYQADPVDPETVRAGSTWFKRVYYLYMNVTF